MVVTSPFIIGTAILIQGAWAIPTWPSSIDEIEDLMFLNTGYHSRGFSAGVTPCSFSKQGPSRIASAEWIRTAFHDMATGNVFTGVGGLDASIVYELAGNGGENIGTAFNTTLETYTPFFSSRSTMADLIALGVYTAVRSCGGPIVKIRAGRVDATGRGASGVPQPENSQGTFINQFIRTGFNTSDMIAVTACGHTIGGVHASNFPQITAPRTVPNDYQLFDSTTIFDEKIASDFVGGVVGNPLTGSLAKRNTRDSDTKVFTADRNVTITALANAATFQTTCARVLQKMVEVVPSSVTLTAPIEPYEVKPSGLQLSLAGNGTTITFAGEIRVRTTVRPSSAVSRVELLFKDRLGASNCGSCVINAEYKGSAQGFDDTFAFYGFSASLPVDTSISRFNVRLFLSSGGEVLYDNNGSGYAVQDTIMLQPKQSCILDGNTSGNFVAVAALKVRNVAQSSAVTLSLSMKVPRSCCVTPALTMKSTPMKAQMTIGPYTLYSGNYSLESAYKLNTKFDVSVTNGGVTFSDSFKNSADLGSSCTPFGSDNPPKPDYKFEGCYTDSVEMRTLAGAAFTDDKMTVKLCSTKCKNYQYFGLEYGRECYCGNIKNSGAMPTPEKECSTPCGGNDSETCGASFRVSIYKDTTWVPTVNPEIPGYSYTGCYNDTASSRTLSGSFVYNDKMTVELCAAFCNGSNYFGTEYFSECYCGSSLSPESALKAESDCSYFCSGNSTQYCGGSNRINIYRKK